jgi:uncharacterized protein (DUF486 family)
MNDAVFWKTAGLLALSNVFMAFARYGHLNNFLRVLVQPSS